MKSNKHPKSYEMVVHLTNGEKITVMTTVKKESYRPDMDSLAHGAWTGETRIGVEQDSKVAKFNKKHGGVSWL